MKYLIPAFFATTMILAASTAAADESFRCGQHLIDVGDARDKVLEYCGEPTSREGWVWTTGKKSDSASRFISRPTARWAA